MQTLFMLSLSVL